MMDSKQMKVKMMKKSLLCSGLSVLVVLYTGLAFSLNASADPAKPFLKNTNAPAKEQLVEFNTNSYKFHNPRCKWAIRCTRNCIRIPRSEAVKQGGVPCKVCGGR